MENVFELVGVQKYDFKDKEGKQVKGMKIYFVMDPSAQQRENNFVGRVCDSHFFPSGSNIPSQIQCGSNYEFIFGYRNGQARISGFKAVNK